MVCGGREREGGWREDGTRARWKEGQEERGRDKRVVTGMGVRREGGGGAETPEVSTKEERWTCFYSEIQALADELTAG